MKEYKEKFGEYVFLTSTMFSILALALICIFIFGIGIPTIMKIGFSEFLFGAKWKPSSEIYGILPMIVGSIYVTIGALILGVPIGIFTAIYLSYFASEKKYYYIKPLINLLAGIPSVVYGFFGLMVIVPIIRNRFSGSGQSLLAAIIVLAIMILPTIINISETSIKAVSKNYYEGSLALGATHERSVVKVVLPAAKSGILASIILGTGRAIGETMAVIMVAGNQAIMPNSMFKGIRTLTSNIVLEMSYAQDMHRNALIATATILFFFILIINIAFNFIKKGNLYES